MTSENEKKLNGHYLTKADLARAFNASSTTVANWTNKPGFPGGFSGPWEHHAVERFLALIGSPKVETGVPDLGRCWTAFSAFCDAVDGYRKRLQAMAPGPKREDLIASLDRWLLRNVVWCAVIRTSEYASRADLPLDTIIGDALDEMGGE